MTYLSPGAQQRRDEARLHLVGAGLLEGLLAGAVLGPALLLSAVGLTGSAGDLGAAVAFSVVAAFVGAPSGLAGGVLALVVLGLLARWRPGRWTTSRAAWLAPAITVGVTTAVVGALGAGWWFITAAVPAAWLTAWRVRRAVDRYATNSVTTKTFGCRSTSVP